MSLSWGAATALHILCGNCSEFPVYPVRLEVVADLPRTDNGKGQNYKLHERGVPPACRDWGARG